MKSKYMNILMFAVMVLVAAGLLLIAVFGVGENQYGGVRNINQGLELVGGVDIVYQAGQTPQTGQMANVQQVLRNRLDRNNWTEGTVSVVGTDRLEVQIPGVSDPDAVAKVIGTAGVLEFRDSSGTVLLTGADVASATAGSVTDQTSGAVKSVVNLTFSSEGAQKFKDATTANLGKTLSIYMDNTLLSAPTINVVIPDGKGYIEGNFTPQSAKDLAAQISDGALPFALNNISQSSVGATLGQDALKTSLIAGIIGMALVLLFMLVIYRMAGLAADIALLIYVGLVLIILSLAGITLTLPGIAGIILSIGMAVDANIIIFERLKEEIRLGKTMRTSIAIAFHRALPAIIDGHVTVIISSIVLYFLGTGTVKGFAQTLGLGVVASLFTAVLVTRLLMKFLIGSGLRKPSLYRVNMHVDEYRASSDAETAAAAAGQN